jgi:oligoendopeptidase F
LNNYTSLALSETFSQFGEKLLTQYLLEKAETAEERLHIMIDNVDAQISSIHRQIAFANFEEQAFREKKMGAFNEQSLTRIFQNKMKDYLGFEPNGGAEKEWIVIHHIFNSPWYCRYYAISQLIVNRLWEKYQNDKEGTFTFFFYRMAVNGAYLDLENVLSSFELNIKDRDFFYKGINILKEDVLRMVNQAKELGYSVPEIDF